MNRKLYETGSKLLQARRGLLSESSIFEN